MPSSRTEKSIPKHTPKRREARNFAQLGLDFTSVSEYINLPRKEGEPMNHELFESLDSKVTDLVNKYQALKDENVLLSEENERYKTERETLRSRVDAIIGKLDGI